MYTIAPDLAEATALAARHLSYHHPMLAAQLPAPTAGMTTMAALVLIVAFVAMAGRAASRMITLFAEFLQLAAAITGFVFAVAIALMVAVALLVH